MPGSPRRGIVDGMTTTTARLTRPRDGRMIGGVCAGIARRLGMKPGTVRLLAVVSCLLPGPQFLAYLVLWVVIPAER